MPKFRPKTLDDKIWKRVHNNTEYKLPNRFNPTDIVLDIGSHIGSLAHTVIQRGAGVVYAYEAHPENFEYTRQNLKEFANAFPFNLAVTRSDELRPEFLFIKKKFPKFNLNKKLTNTGGLGARLTKGDEYYKVKTISFDKILSIITNPIRLVKLDCEGAEFPIILTSNKLDMVNEIVGEYHLGNIYPDIPHKLHLLHKKLQDFGFEFNHTPSKKDKKLGKFHAWRS